jgi:hypothetical protein
VGRTATEDRPKTRTSQPACRVCLPLPGQITCGHDGVDDSSQGTFSLGERFRHDSLPVNNLKGEEFTLFLGISRDGSPLCLHHFTGLGSTIRWVRESVLLVALAGGLQQSLTVTGLTPRDYFASILSGRDDGIASEFLVPPFLKLLSLCRAGTFKKLTPSSKHRLSLEALCLLPMPPFLVPCMAENAYSAFAELRLACAEHIVVSKILCVGNTKIALVGTAKSWSSSCGGRFNRERLPWNTEWPFLLSLQIIPSLASPIGRMQPQREPLENSYNEPRRKGRDRPIPGYLLECPGRNPWDPLRRPRNPSS